MAGIVAHVVPEVIYGNENPYLSSELNDFEEVVTVFAFYDTIQPVNGFYSVERMPASNTWAIRADTNEAFKADFYERIHVLPTRIELGTVANTQTRQISLWNAYTTQSASLDAINILNGGGITINGDDPPLVMPPLRELLYELRVTPNGPPQINAQLQFDFSDVDDPLPVVIVGNRAVVMPVMPEVPVRETWSWLTDVHISVDGSEQRVGLRKVPRRTVTTKLVFSSEQELREQYKILLGASGRLFIPYWQYASTLLADANTGDTALAVETGPLDLRDGDYVLVINPGIITSPVLVQVQTVGSTTLSLLAPLGADLKRGAQVVAIYASMLPNGVALNRAAWNEAGSMNLRSDATYPKPSFQRPGNTATLRMLDGLPVLTFRPLVDDDVSHTFDTGQETDDAKTGLVQLTLNWDFTKVEQDVMFKARRVGASDCGGGTGVQEMDYWRKFFDTLLGSLGVFLAPSFRPDQELYSNVGVGADSAILAGPTYVDNFYSAEPYQYLALTTEAGVHYVKVTAAVKDADGNSGITFTPALPSTAGWNNVTEVSYLVKQRIVDDKVELLHFARDTFFNFRTRTAKA